MKMERLDVLLLILILVMVGISARYALRGNLYFHTDIARDFLLMEDIWNTKKPTLIGPKLLYVL